MNFDINGPARQAIISVLDFETTGPVENYPDEPWQLGLIQLVNGRLEPDTSFESLLNVGIRPVNKYVPGRYGELKEQVARAPKLGQIWETIRPVLQFPLAAHNIATEKKILTKAFPLYRPPVWIDTLKMVRTAFPGWEKHRLEYIITELGLKSRLDTLFPGREFHDALYDSAASALCIEYILTQPYWSDLSLGELSRIHPGEYYQLKRG